MLRHLANRFFQFACRDPQLTLRLLVFRTAHDYVCRGAEGFTPPASVTPLLPPAGPYAKFSEAAMSTLVASLKRYTKMLSTIGVKQVHEARRGAGGRPPSMDEESAYEMGLHLQTHLLSRAAESASTAVALGPPEVTEQGGLRYPSEDTATVVPSIVACIHYSIAFFEACDEVVTAADEALAREPLATSRAGAGGTEMVDAVDAALCGSLVGRLLPHFATAATAFQDHWWAARYILPRAINVLSGLLRVCSKFVKLWAATMRFDTHERSKWALEATLEPGAGKIVRPVAPAHPLLNLLKSLTSCAAALAGGAVAGTPEREEEESVGAWLQCSVFVGGIYDDTGEISNPGEADSEKLLSWRTATLEIDPRLAAVARELGSAQRYAASDSRSAGAAPEASPAATTSGGSDATLLWEWLQAALPERGLDARKRRHPEVEAPCLLAMIMHCGLWEQATAVISVLRSAATQKPEPSQAMREVWKLCKVHVRGWLRSRKTAFDRITFVSEAAEDVADDRAAGAAHGDADAAGAAGGAGAEGAGGVGGGSAAASAVDDPAASGMAPTQRERRKVPLVHPGSMDELLLHVKHRAEFLAFKMRPWLRAAPEWAELAALSREAENAAQLDPGIHLQDFRFLHQLIASWGEAAAAERHEDDWDAGADELRRRAAAVMLYLREGFVAPPAALHDLIELRERRALQRAYGLEAQLTLLALIERSPYRVLLFDALLPLYRAMRGRVEHDREVDSVTTEVSDVALLGVRHHHLKALGGCAQSTVATVQVAFERLYATLADLLKTSVEAADVSTARAVMRCWALDWEERDHAFLLKVGIPGKLKQFTGMRCRVKQYADTCRSAAAAAVSATGGRGGLWKEWPVDRVVCMLRNGTLTRAELVCHAQAGATKRGVKLTGPLSGDAVEAATRYSAEELIVAYKEFVSDNDPFFLEPIPDVTLAMELSDRTEFEARNLADHGTALLHMIAARCICGTGAPSDKVSTESTALHSLFLDVVLVDLQDTAAHLQGMRRQGITAGKGGTLKLEPGVVDASARLQLGFVLGLCPTPLVTKYLAQAPALRCLLALLRSGSVEVQRLVLRLLRFVLPSVRPAFAGKALRECVTAHVRRAHGDDGAGGAGGAGDDAESVEHSTAAGGGDSKDAETEEDKKRMFPFLLSFIARVTCPVGNAAAARRSPPHLPPNPIGYGAGHLYMCVASEAVALLRSLQSHPGKRWRHAIVSELRAHLRALSDELGSGDPGAADAEAEGRTGGAGGILGRLVFANAAAMLWVVGGGEEVLRTGAKAALIRRQGRGAGVSTSVTSGEMTSAALARALGASASEGTILSRSRDGKYVTVLFGEVGEALPQQVPAANVIPLDDVAPSTAGVAATLPRVLKFLVELSLTTVGVASAADMWRVEVKARALGALQFVLQRPDFARSAVQADLLPSLFRAALSPIRLRGFHAMHAIAFRWQSSLERLLEASLGVVYAPELKGGSGADAAALLTSRTELAVGELVVAPWDAAARMVSGDSASGAEELMYDAHCLAGMVRQQPLISDEEDFSWLTADSGDAEEGASDTLGGNEATNGDVVAVNAPTDLRGEAEAVLSPVSSPAQLPAGSLVCVSNRSGELRRLAAVSIIGTVIRASTSFVSVRVLHAQSCMGDELHFEMADLRKVTHLFGCPLQGGVSMLRTLVANAGAALASLRARRCVASLLLSWPVDVPFSYATLGGTRSIVDLAKMITAGEDAFAWLRDETTAEKQHESPLVRGLRAKMVWMMEQEAKPKSWEGVTWKCAMCTVVNEGTLESCAVCSAPRPALTGDSEKLCDTLVTDAVGSLLASTDSIVLVERRESAIPAPPGYECDGVVSVPGAKGLLVSFETGSRTDENTGFLGLFLDSARKNVVVRYSGSSHQFRPVVLKGDSLWFRFRSSSPTADTSTQYGFRMYVLPVWGLVWRQESEVVADPSVEWAFWLLDFLMTDAQKLVPTGALHNNRVLAALVRYLRAPGVPHKGRVVQLVTQLLSGYESFPPGAPPCLQLMDGMLPTFEAQRTAERSAVHLFLPRRLQQLCELLVTTLAVSSAITAPTAFRAAPRLSSGSHDELDPPIRPSLPSPDGSSAELSMLQDVVDCLDALAKRLRPPDRVVCRAFLDARGQNTEMSPAAVVRHIGRLSTSLIDVMEFTPLMDVQLTRWAQRVAALQGSDNLLHLSPTQLSMTDEYAMSFPAIATVDTEILRFRFALLAFLNRRLKRCIELIDVGNNAPWSLGHRIRVTPHLVFPVAKLHLVQAAINRTWNTSTSGLRVLLDSRAAQQSKEDGHVDPSRSRCLFVQLFEQLQSCEPLLLRSKLDEKARLFIVRFRGMDGRIERGVDWGGIYRDSLTRVTEELCSTDFNLFVPVPNQRDHGTFGETFIPNPRHTSTRGLAMFEFTGKLMGISMRQKADLPFMFPPLLWKLLVGQPATAQDLQDIDTMVGRLVISAQEAKEDDELTMSFSVPNCFGEQVELVPRGSSLRVTIANRDEFVELALSLRLGEFNQQVAALRSGFITIIPERSLQLLTWEELQLRVCGSPDIDIELLRRHTTYRGGYHGWHSAVRRFWRAVSQFTQEELQGLIKFAWGRTRLPQESQWPTTFKLAPHGGGDAVLPIAHSCFFQIDLPSYSSSEVAKKRLITAIHYGLGSFNIA